MFPTQENISGKESKAKTPIFLFYVTKFFFLLDVQICCRQQSAMERFFVLLTLSPQR